MTITADQCTRAAQALTTWLNPKGVRFFQLLIAAYGTPSPVLRLNSKRRGIPLHPVHLREGMQVRNFISKLDACASWDQDELDEHWSTVVRIAVCRPPAHVMCLPTYGVPVYASLRSSTGKVTNEWLIRVREDDVTWRTADDGSEVNEMAWNVVAWFDASRIKHTVLQKLPKAPA